VAFTGHDFFLKEQLTLYDNQRRELAGRDHGAPDRCLPGSLDVECLVPLPEELWEKAHHRAIQTSG
jgi:hypothetical protein